MSGSFNQRGGKWVVAQNSLTLVVLCGGLLARDQWINAGTLVAGLVLMGAGALLGLASVRALGRNRTAFPMPLTDGILVQSGVFGIVRHPIYASLILLGFGWGLVWSSVPALVTAAVLAVVLNSKAIVEERWLRQRFAGYAEYARRVCRLLPWIY